MGKIASQDALMKPIYQFVSSNLLYIVQNTSSSHNEFNRQSQDAHQKLGCLAKTTNKPKTIPIKHQVEKKIHKQILKKIFPIAL